MKKVEVERGTERDREGELRKGRGRGL